jgi:two-component system, OmpR family, response regulator
MTVLTFLPQNVIEGRLERSLIAAHHSIRKAQSIKECTELARSDNFDAVIIQSYLVPFFEALTLITFVRMENPQAAIFLIANDLDLHQRLRLFDAGVDDLIQEPFFASEFMARLRRSVQLRQAASNFAALHEISILRCGTLELDLVRRKVVRSGKLIELRPKEFLLLEFLARNVNRPLTRTMIMEHVWSSSFEGLSNVVDVYINSLRNKIDRDFQEKLIQTNRGVGYTLVVPSGSPLEINRRHLDRA